MENQMKRIIESEKNPNDITDDLTKDEALDKGEIHQLEGKTVKNSIIRNDGSVQIMFQDGTTLEAGNSKDMKIK